MKAAENPDPHVNTLIERNNPRPTCSRGRMVMKGSRWAGLIVCLGILVAIPNLTQADWTGANTICPSNSGRIGRDLSDLSCFV